MGLTANLTIPGNQITGNGSVTGNGGENVIDLTQVNMTNGAFTINGTANDMFIFRVSGQFSVGNSSIRATGGVTPNHILWDITGTNQTVKSPNGPGTAPLWHRIPSFRSITRRLAWDRIAVQ